MRIAEDSIFVGQSQNGHHYAGHAHFWERALMSRRQFAKTTIGASGAMLISSLWMPTTVLAHGGGAAPRPVPGGFQAFGPGTEVFHAFDPAPHMEPSTITDFHGGFGVAALRGMGSGTNKKTGQTIRLIYDVDMRFMQGTYIGMDGEKHRGTFTLVWLDLYKGKFAPENQIHDFNPGITASGLFWTIPVSHNAVDFDFDDARASIDVDDLEIEDYFNIVNALKDGHSVSATVSFHIDWAGTNNRYVFRDEKNHFRIHVIEDSATISWSAQEKGFSFTSDSANTTTTIFAEIGRERNGAFFPAPNDNAD